MHDGNDKLRETQMIAIAEDEQATALEETRTPVIATPPQGWW